MHKLMILSLLTMAILKTMAAIHIVTPWMDLTATPAQRAATLLRAMNTTEKLALLHGYNGPYVGNVPGNSRLKIPALNLNDGPQGFRGDSGTSTCWPSGLTMAASWDTDAMFAWGKAMGEEFWAKGANVQLGPGMNVARVPRNGRNFEYLSGEDPHLGYILVQPVIKGIQGQHVIANVKHYINNNQETNRGSVSENVDERTEFEIYLPPWKGAIEAGVGSLMCSYNKINSIYSCENNETLNTDLKTRLGFSGWVMSDWGATHSTSINQGLDQEMPGDSWMGDRLAAMVASGQVTQETVDNSVMRILTPMFTMGLFDQTNNGSLGNNVTSHDHNLIARNLSAVATVLLKNENEVLPLSKSIKTIAIIGTQASGNTIVHGGGSGQVVPPYVISPEDGIKARLGFSPPRPTPFTCDQSKFEDDTDYYQPGNPSAPAESPADCCAQCGARGDCNVFSFTKVAKTCWFKQTTVGKRANAGVVSGACRTPTPPSPGGKVCSPTGQCVIVVTNDPVQAAEAAAQADVAIVFLGTSSSEGSDRTDLSLPEDNLVNIVASANANTIVVVSTPGAVLMPWATNVSSLLVNFMPGQEAGNAVTDILFGDVNPSARLPLTMPNRENEVNFTQSQYPGLDNGENATYLERLEVGYRWYTAHNVKPNFPFGHGLSYTTFEYSNLVVKGRTVSLTVKNTGALPGADVPQVYIGFPASVGEPPQQLRGFDKVMLQPGESRTLSWTLQDQQLAIWDINVHDWQLVSGSFQIMAGPSSGDIRLTGMMVV